MSRARITIEDYRASVVAVPPIALSDDLQVAREANTDLVRHIENGGVRTLLYGGNANLYNFDLGRYADALAMMDDAASPSINIITSVGPDFGKLSDQLPVVERSAVRNVMLLPITFPVDAGGLLRGIRFAADRLGFGVILYIKRENYLSPDLLAELAADGSVAFVKYAVERKEPSEDAYLDAILLKQVAGYVAQTALDGELRVEGDFIGYLAQVAVGGKEADLAGHLKVGAGHLLRSFDRKAYGLGLAGKHLEAQLL